MSTVSINLSANTAAYVKRIKDARTDTDRNIIKMEQRIDKFAQDVNKNFTSVGGSIDSMIGGLRGMAGGGYVAAIAGVGFAAVSVANQMKELATQTIETHKQIQIAAERSKVSSDEIQRWGMVASTVGLSLEKFGDINKDVFDKLGDYVTTGSGPFVDFFDVMGDKVGVTSQQLQEMSGPDVLQTVVAEMERVGASGSQMTWVLESIGNDASNLLPLLKDGAKGFRDLRDRMSEMDTVADVLASATTEVQIMDAAFTTMWGNFGTMMTNEFEGLYNRIATATMKVNNFLAGINKQSIIDNYKDSLIDGTGFSVNIADDKNTLKAKRAALDELVKAEVDANYELTKERRKHSIEAARLQQQLDANRAKDGKMFTTAQREEVIAALEAEKQAAAEITARYTAEAEKKYAEHYGRLREIDALNEHTASESNSGQESTDKTFKVEPAEDEIEYLRQKTKFTTNLTNAQKQLVKQEADLAAMKEAQAIAVSSSPDSEDIVKAWETKIRAQKKAITDSNRQIETGNKSLAKLDENEAKRKKKAIDDAEKASKDAAARQKGFNEKEAQAQMQAAQREVEAAQTKADKITAIERMKFLALAQMEKRYQVDLAARLKAGTITEVEAKTEELNTAKHFAGMKQVIEKESAKQLATEKEAEFNTELERKAMRAEAGNALDLQLATEKLEWYAANKDLFVGMEAEYNDKVYQLTKDRAEAEQAIEAAKYQTVRGSLDEIAGAFDEHTGAARAAFALSKGVSIAEATVNMEANAIKAKKAAMGMGTSPADIAAGETAAMVSRIKDGVSIATMTAQAIGQFHSGVDEVDTTGSYILKEGERVVQAAANKDLTNFLEGNKAGSGVINVDASLTIEGDTQIDESRFNALLVQQREQVAKSVKLAQRESPSLR
ncbi:MAG: hypothetical protein ACRC2Y_04820 [Aeromonas veronii]